MSAQGIMEQHTVTLTFFSLSAYLDGYRVWGRYATAAHEDVARRRWTITVPAAVVARGRSMEGVSIERGAR